VRSLFLKIFLWFWATLIATGISLVLTFIFGPRSVPLQWHAILMDAAHSSGAIVVSEAERGGDSAAAAYIGWLEGETHLKTCLFDIAGGLVAGRDCGSFQSMTSRVTAAKPSAFSMRYGIARVAMRLKGSNGHEYIFATELPAGPRAALGLNRTTIALQWGVALLVSGLICYLLTRYLTAPILRLREASQQLAAGDLSTRAAAVIERRHDELGDLVRDFDAMASRIEELVSRQRQLISDVSHELRSPLARLYVALDLGRERKGDDPAFDHIEKDIGILNEMIGRLLTVARLDTSAPPVPMVPVDLTEIVSQIVRDADFESRERNGSVELTAHEEFHVQGNAKLLQSAIENLVRNAIAYTEPGTSVEVLLQPERRSNESFVRFTVRDYGPGVPESELVNIFQPFYRVSDARDRGSGGAGLGLAIADRAIRIHGGTIRAENVAPRGLQVEIVLPRLSVTA
jgi:two-component system, OmpR family, sensor histidine kinase CpxA